MASPMKLDMLLLHEEDLFRLLEARRADNEQMLTMIRAEVGDQDGG